MPARPRAFEALYADSPDPVLNAAGRETFEAVSLLQSIQKRPYQPAAGANYPKGRFGDSLRQIAQLIKAGRRRGNGLRRRRRLGSSRQRSRARALREGQLASAAGRVRPSAGAPSGRTWATACDDVARGHHVRVRPHRARKRQPRHRSRPRQLHVRDGRRRARRQSVRPVARPRARSSSTKGAIWP